MAQLLEAGMVICFGISWPLSILKAFRARSAKGMSLPFLLFVFIGYLSGITSKLLTGNITYVFAFYVLNTVMVGTNIFLYFRNRRLDRIGENK